MASTLSLSAGDSETIQTPRISNMTAIWRRSSPAEILLIFHTYSHFGCQIQDNPLF